MDENKKKSQSRPILHVLVVGFHHKKGCQVEYSYPPLVEGSSDGSDCPPGWKYLPTLALPDGSHNFEKDTVFFNLPSLTEQNTTVFGISCFRQIPAERLKNLTKDITRSTVQKSVCVLSRVPLYGHIQVKMELITHAYFEEGDFTKVSLLEDTYHNLNDCIEQIEELSTASQLYVGLSTRDLILKLRHKALLLYKLVLLERKVLFFHSPVEPLCSTILTLLSLHPGMLVTGLTQSACFRPSRPMSPVPEFADRKFEVKDDHLANGDLNNSDQTGDNHIGTSELDGGSNKAARVSWTEVPAEVLEKASDKPDGNQTSGLDPSGNSDQPSWSERPPMSRDPSSADIVGDSNIQSTMAQLALHDAAKCGLPLNIFSQGYMCLPYLSLPYMDMLSDQNVNGYILGACNVLFKQKKKLVDVLVEVECGRIETADVELKRALHLSTEDLRFADYLVRQVSAGRTPEDTFLDGVGWEGSDDWLRSQFHAYTLSLLRTSLLPEGSKEYDGFNKWFMLAWQNTRSYKEWAASPAYTSSVLEIAPGHPFTGQLSVADMKLRFAHTMQTTEGGRKLNQAMVSTSRVMATTGRAVGGALSQAKGALSSWWSNLTIPPTVPPSDGSDQPVEQGIDALDQPPHPILQV